MVSLEESVLRGDFEKLERHFAARGVSMAGTAHSWELRTQEMNELFHDLRFASHTAAKSYDANRNVPFPKFLSARLQVEAYVWAKRRKRERRKVVSRTEAVSSSPVDHAAVRDVFSRLSRKSQQTFISLLEHNDSARLAKIVRGVAACRVIRRRYGIDPQDFIRLRCELLSLGFHE